MAKRMSVARRDVHERGLIADDRLTKLCYAG